MIEWIFPTPVYVYKGSFDETFLIQNEIKQKLPEIKENDSWDTPGGWEDPVQTTISHRWNSINDYGLKNLENYIQKHTYAYVDELKPFINNEIFMSHSWFNITSRGESQEWHSHTDSFISGVYYYKTNTKDGDLMIRNPVQFTQKGLFPAGKKAFEKIYYPPQEGMIILFPGWLDHRVGVNTTDDDRITIAFNWLTINEKKEGIIKK
jgi:uncharacterized protein (TIGR02466 family)